MSDKKTSCAFFSAAIIITLLLTGCSLFPLHDIANEINRGSDTTEAETHAVQGGGQSQGTQSQGSLYHYYSLLDSDQKQLYDTIYSTIVNHRYETPLDMVEHSTLDHCFESVIRDHPEIYYVRGYTYSQNNYTGKINMFAPNYSMSAGEMEYCNKQIDAYVQSFMLEAPVNGTEYEKIKYIYDYVISHTEYDLETESNQSLYGAFALGRCACNGYAKAVQYLANKLGIYSVFVVGTANGNGTNGLHAWNIVKIDGQFCQVDATWGDQPIKTDAMVVSASTYDYLCANDEIFFKNHFEDDFAEYPACTTLDNYYYKREGLYLDSYDPALLSPVFRNAENSQQNFVMIKCSSYEVLTQYKSYLMTEQNIFNYIYASNVKSSEYRELNLIVFSW